MAQFLEDVRADGTGVLRVAGEIDLAVADELVEAARGCLARSEAIDVDLGGVSFIDSSGLGALIRLRLEAAEQAKSLHLVNISAAVERLLQVTGLRETFDLRPT